MENDLTFSQKIEVVKTVRITAAQTCLLTFQRVFKDIKKTSEFKFANNWVKLMEKSNKIHGYWYQPPPSGVAALFFDGDDTSRATHESLREKKYWPKINNYLSKFGGGYLFISPFYFANNIPLIGDFGFSFYTGNNKQIKEHFNQCSVILNTLYQKIELGLKFSDLYIATIDIMKTNGYENFIKSSTDNFGTNIGHTIPFLENNPSAGDLELINSSNGKKIYNLINKERIFINENSDYIIGKNCGFTFEPRFISLKNEKLPMFSLHQIVLFHEGRKQILSSFNGIFNLLKMDYIKTDYEN